MFVQGTEKVVGSEDGDRAAQFLNAEREHRVSRVCAAVDRDEEPRTFALAGFDKRVSRANHVVGRHREQRIGPYASSNRKRLPSTLAARAIVRKVTDSFFGSRRRSSAARLVRIARAMSDLYIRFSPIPRSSCHAITRFTAAASPSAHVPSSARSSSSEEPRCLRFFNLISPICVCGPSPDRDLTSASGGISLKSRR